MHLQWYENNQCASTEFLLSFTTKICTYHFYEQIYNFLRINRQVSCVHTNNKQSTIMFEVRKFLLYWNKSKLCWIKMLSMCHNFLRNEFSCSACRPARALGRASYNSLKISTAQHWLVHNTKTTETKHECHKQIQNYKHIKCLYLVIKSERTNSVVLSTCLVPSVALCSIRRIRSTHMERIYKQNIR